MLDGMLGIVVIVVAAAAAAAAAALIPINICVASVWASMKYYGCALQQSRYQDWSN